MLPDIEDQYAGVAFIEEAHGVHGEVLLDITRPGAEEMLIAGTLVHIMNQHGDLIPARITEIRSNQKPDHEYFITRFDHITDRSEAVPLEGSTIMLEKEKLPETEPAPADNDSAEDVINGEVELEGFRIVDTDQQAVGSVLNVNDETAQTVIVAEAIESGDLFFIPLVSEYVVEIHEAEKVVVGQNLDQLLDLNM